MPALINNQLARRTMEQRLMENISVDCVIFGFDKEQLKVLLVERPLKLSEKESDMSFDYSLAGYHIFENEDLDSAAARIVYDLTGLSNLDLHQFYSFGSLDRLEHPNDKIWFKQFGDRYSNRVITVAYYSLLNISSVNIIQKHRKVAWQAIDKVKNLAYDHDEILNKAILNLRYKIKYEPVAFDLLDAKFTLSQMQKLYEAILGKAFDKRNFRKKVSQMPYVVPLNEKQKGVAHKPAQLFMFSKDIYEKTRKERFDFFV